MHNSEHTDKLFAALSLFQGEVTNPPREADNPFFKSKYTQLDAMIDHVRPALAKHGLSVIQMPCSAADGVGVVTALCHASGQYVQSDPYYLKLSKQDAQAGGSAITYARRYAYAAILGIASDTDDDGNAASKAPEKGSGKPAAPPASHAKGPSRTERINRLCAEHDITLEAMSVIVDMLTKTGAVANKHTRDMTDIEFDVMMLAVSKEIVEGNATQQAG